MTSSGVRIASLVQAIRGPEVLLMMGFPAAAGAFGAQSIAAESLLSYLGCLVALAWIAASVYAYNRWAGQVSDASDPKFQGSPVGIGTVIRAQLMVTTVVCCVTGLALFALVSRELLGVVAILWLCWIAYSHPHGLKGLPFAGTVVHLVGGSMMFLVPYALQRALDHRGFYLAAIFAFAFASGHANHEVMDRDADQRSGLRTTAVVFGSRFVHFVGLLLATAGYVTAGLGWASDVLAPTEALPFLLAWPAHMVFGLRFACRSLDAEAAVAYRWRYRLVFSLAVAASLAPHLWALMG